MKARTPGRATKNNSQRISEDFSAATASRSNDSNLLISAGRPLPSRTNLSN